MTTTARAALVTWGAAVTALVALLMPGDWRTAAVVPGLGTWAMWRFTASGRHAGPGRTSPLPGPAGGAPGPSGRAWSPIGSMALDAELDWRSRNELLPREMVPELAHDEYPPEIPAVLVALADDGFVADVRRACACEPDPDDVWPESEHPSPPYLPAAPPSAAGTGAAGEVPDPAADSPRADPPPGTSPADGWDEASLQELRDAPSVLDDPPAGGYVLTVDRAAIERVTAQWGEWAERLADTGEIAMAPVRAEWAAQLEDQDADARSFIAHLREAAMTYRLGLAGGL